MNLTYRTAISTRKPDAIEIQKTTVYLRKNIHKETYTDESDNPFTCWVCDEATMTHDEFNQYSKQLMTINAVKGADDSDHISQIVKNGSDSNNNQLILMEAIADLYDLISKTM